MKIALVILHAEPEKGGAEGYTVNLASSLKRRGHEVSVLATSFAESARLVDNVPLDGSGRTRRARYRSFIDSLDRHLAGTRYDVVHAISPVRRCDLYHPQAGLSAEQIASGHRRYAGLRSLIHWIGTRLARKRLFVGQIEREMLTHAGSLTIVVSVSDMVKDTARRRYGLPEDRLVTLFNAIDPARFDPERQPDAGHQLRQTLGIAADKVVALIVAQDFHRKGLQPAIEAIAKVSDPRLVLLVVGKPDPTEYRALAATLGVMDRVIFAGATADTYPHYQAADLFVLPTWHDPCSLVVLEALAMGLPTITTAQNGAHEVIVEGVHGFTLPNPAAVDLLAEWLRALLPDDRRRAMRQSCLELRPRLAYEHHLDELVAIYERVASAGGR
jgi:UDP-glucose:(heptosyl)LPS alpha-1,3-glucosyltransferase